MQPRVGRRGSVTVACLALLACGGDPSIEGEDGEVKGGVETCERPEVGYLSMSDGACTATLVSPSTILTASHCYDYESGDRSGEFTVTTCDGASVSRWVDRVTSLPYTILPPFGNADLAIAHLTEPMPAEVRPADIAKDYPNLFEDMTIFGYGCNDWDENGAGVKRKASLTWGAPHWVSCPGDSGGPVFDSEGRIALVTSWGAPSRWVPVDDAYADPVGHRAELLAIIAEIVVH